MAENRPLSGPPSGPGGPGGPGGPPGPGGPGGPGMAPPGPPPFPGGYHGKVLRVNLSAKSITTDNISGEFCRKYLGGAGFIAYYLLKELKPGIDALSPDNKLIFALGPATGLALPGASRVCAGAKSPLTGGVAKAESGGFWMAELKRAGYDAVIVEGKADNPVYLWVHDGEAEIKDASHLWGKETLETETAIRQELGDDRIHFAMIGPAGEKMVRFACIMVGCHDALGRGGLGAVMGSKNLKAVAARGHNLPPVASEDKVKEIRQAVAARPSPFSLHGTGGPDTINGEVQGNLPVRNFREGVFPEIKEITSIAMKESGLRTGMEGCYACGVRCKKVTKIDEGPYKSDPAYGGPEYETIASLGSDCAVSDVKALIKANAICNANSMDTISAGSTIAFAMECFEKGLITAKDTGGLDLTWGNAEAMVKACEMIAGREGFGDLMAEGTLRLAQKIGKGSEAFALHVKGLEPGMHEPRLKPGLGLGFATHATGADHCGTIQDPMVANEMMLRGMHPLGIHNPVPPNDLGPRKVALVRLGQFKAFLDDSMVLCSFTGYGWDGQVELLKAVTGWDTGIGELMRIGERITTMFRLFNLREGMTAADDMLPERFFQPKTNGALSNTKLDKEAFKNALRYYYVLMGWDANGVPLPEKVEELYID